MRTDGYAPIADYAAIGDGRTVTLVAADGSMDWLCLPDLDSPSVFGRVLDEQRGGSVRLAPATPFESSRRYLPDTNVLQTTFRTASGSVRVTDAMLLSGRGVLAPQREVVRKIEGVSGIVHMGWSVEPRFDYAQRRPHWGWHGGIPVASAGRDAVAVVGWDVGSTRIDGGGVHGEFAVQTGRDALLAVVAAHQEPVVAPGRSDIETRLAHTVSFWRRWSGDRNYQGPWRDAVVRSALALKLLIHAPSGAIAAAATTSLPEEIGGERNWDYRYSWVRDASFTLQALLSLGCAPEAESFFWWLLHASQLTRPRLQVLYRLNGGTGGRERALPLAGYRGSGPVRVGNGASGQLQLGIYGDLMDAAWTFARAAGHLDQETGRRLADIADLICRIWRRPDAGIWEVRSDPQHFTHSAMLCSIALERAIRMAETGTIPHRHSDRWRTELRAIGEFIEADCWSTARGSYLRAAGSDDLDASLLLGAIMGYGSSHPRRWRSTVDAIRRELGEGALLRRYGADDGVRGREGAFVCCSFWLVDVLARLGDVDQAVTLMEQLLPMANDVGLYAEEAAPDGAFLGNTPQALVHLALINAAVSCGKAGAR